MQLNQDTNILIVGLGVIGGGYAKALTAKGYRVRCITKEQKDIDYALAHGIIHEGSTRVDPAVVGKADLVILALYPHIVLEWLQSYQQYLKPGVIVTDVTGVKGTLVQKAQALLRPDAEFISAHPMAGRESSGVEFNDMRFNVTKDSTFRMTGDIDRLTASGLTIDTVRMYATERNRRISYLLHAANRDNRNGTGIASAGLLGIIAGNRATVLLRQYDFNDSIGVRFGIDATMDTANVLLNSSFM